jgi:hypothetical protein
VTGPSVQKGGGGFCTTAGVKYNSTTAFRRGDKTVHEAQMDCAAYVGQAKRVSQKRIPLEIWLLSRTIDWGLGDWSALESCRLRDQPLVLDILSAQCRIFIAIMAHQQGALHGID